MNNYPAINLGREAFQSSRTQGSCDSKSFMNNPEIEEPLIKKFTRNFFENGLLSTLEEFSHQNENNSRVFSVLSKMFLFVIDSGNNLFNSNLKIKGNNSIETFSRTRYWSKSTIRCIEFHPNYFKLAIAISDDTIRIYGQQNVGQQVNLKSNFQ